MSAPPGGDMRRPHSTDGHVAGPGGMHGTGPPPLIHLTGGKDLCFFFQLVFTTIVG